MALLCSSLVRNRCLLTAGSLESVNILRGYHVNCTTFLCLLSSPGVIALFSLPLFYRQRQVITLLIHSLYCYFNWPFISIVINISVWPFLFYHRSKWTASLQNSRPKLTTSRICEHTAIFWHSGAITTQLVSLVFLSRY